MLKYKKIKNNLSIFAIISSLSGACVASVNIQYNYNLNKKNYKI
tara:strand:- start:364 stop:495 length:132 start_codon:yes stop_codon:yes gene_type:complete